MENNKYGLVLSGGGVRGVAQIGAIKALEENGIFPTIISGSSVGAVVGAFYAAEYSWEEMLDFFRSTTLFSFHNFSFRKPGFVDTDKFLEVFQKYFPDDSFEMLKKKLYVTTSDMVRNKTRFVHNGELILPLLASAAFPGVFSPVRINSSLYADGGITNNFPVEPLLSECEKIIGVYVNPIKKITMKDLNSAVSVVERAYSISRANISMQKFSSCHIVISPDELNRFSSFGGRHIDKIFKIGHEETKKVLQLAKVKNVGDDLIL
ncbi:MAG: NTE family protein [Saprospiraceae bacterium]|jgi:NTE family protein